MYVVGLGARTTLAQEADPDAHQGFRLWYRLIGDGLCYQILRRMDRMEFVELYTDYSPGRHEEFTLFVGQRVWEIDTVPEGLTAIEIPLGRYVKFVANREVEDADIRLWSKVERFFAAHPEYERAFTTDIAFGGYRPDKVTLYVAIK